MAESEKLLQFVVPSHLIRHGDETVLPWFAVDVRASRERHVASLLEAKSIVSWLPTHSTWRRSGGKLRRTELPLFPGYLFCQIDIGNRLPVLETKMVNFIVSSGRTPIPIPESEIESLRTLVAHASDPQPDAYVVGRKVRVVEGPLAGVEGVIERTRDKCRIVVGITLLQRGVSAEVDWRAVVPLSLVG